ncbi:HPP family protein [Polymorphobacter fuscus]|uniref:HPP family protein n=1 Tax=Sandarakinorhabdus fusca TaxID=1439888 RepID=A0A7C9GN79_9SPHN|nr:HPP family protein [Polymorphobacter fuscus]KAB7648489.1 HPP family protein [Polymorphobacter fuscus]MQT16016.1 HPP family protein [Polymorphobacter fuscus]NJC07707.1 CBS domain-containing membrane protein [Polymorphobacter fuscus]
MRRYFVPILAGGSFRDRLVACLGALIGIGLTGFICAMLPGPATGFLLVVAPMGASAVLIFAVPTSPLAQPWPVIGGNAISALVGVSVAALVPGPALAAGLAVAGAILAMSLTRSLHPPGGAAALTAVVGGPAVMQAGYGFVVAPVLVNAVVLAALGVVFHRFSGHSYPHRPVSAAGHAMPQRSPRHPADIDKALADLGETFDVSREDLDLLFDRVEHHAAQRRAGKA